MKKKIEKYLTREFEKLEPDLYKNITFKVLPKRYALRNYRDDHDAIPLGYLIDKLGNVFSPTGTKLKRTKGRTYPSVQITHPVTNNRLIYRIDKLLVASITKEKVYNIYHIDGDVNNVNYKNLFHTEATLSKEILSSDDEYRNLYFALLSFMEKGDYMEDWVDG